MTDEKKKVDVKETADSIIRETKAKSNNSQFILWMGALVLGAVLGWMGIPALNEFTASLFCGWGHWFSALF